MLFHGGNAYVSLFRHFLIAFFLYIARPQDFASRRAEVIEYSAYYLQFVVPFAKSF